MPADGLATSVEGVGDRLVLVHGFTQTGRSWKVVADALSSHFEVVAVDAPGHGGSGSVRAGLPLAAQLLGDAGGLATYIGYSMGGRMCLQLALDRPELVQRLVLISATAGIDGPTDRHARRKSDEALAGSIERDGLDAFLVRWVAQPMFAGLRDPELDDRRRNTAAGLASSLRLAGAGAQEPLWDRLGQLSIPVLLLAGERDAKFVTLAERMAAAIAGADLAVVEGAGHTVHLERPRAFLDVVERWLSR
ncbi:2-succinyl-6-hydroxy-2,4-cyclohexadiene-1-carboxylate synthase [soil metagenome]